MPARPIERIDKIRDRSAGLAQCRNVAAQGGNPELERLDQRKPETLGEGGQEQRARAGQEPHHFGIRHRIVLDDRAAQRRTALEHVDDVFGFPAALADQHQ